MKTIEEELGSIESGLRNVLLSISDGVAKVSKTLRTASTTEIGTSNLLGDKQLVADIEADTCIMQSLSSCPSVAMVSSEEQPIDITMPSSQSTDTPSSNMYSVAFDPLDGSSIIGADWTVGSIFAIFSGKGFLQRNGRDMVAAAYAMHGPRTLLILARPINEHQTSASMDSNNNNNDDDNNDISTTTSTALDKRFIVQEFIYKDTHDNNTTTTTHINGGVWVLQRESITIPESKKIFAPANLRASKDNTAYADLITNVWMKEQYTLRYSGGLVPDIHHILAKGGGVFCNPCSQSAPAKLRVLYEVLPLAFIVEAASGSSYCGGKSALDICITQHDDRSAVCMGSKKEVERCVLAMDHNDGK